ncbi:MAG: transcription elongation factor GreA [Chloroflexota bacterium]|nr:transcription elongation factor GreA [Chloroflexota bacterium]
MSEQSLANAATQFLAALQSGKREEYQQEINKFVRWYGMERPVGELAAPDVASYAERVEGTSANALARLEPVRAFLMFAKKEGLTRGNLAVHLKVKKGASRNTPAAAAPRRESFALTAEGRSALEAELDTLKADRPRISEEIRRAAADKDFRENAPLEAAREHQGMMEARIKHLEHVLKSAVVAQGKADTSKVGQGSTVRLRDLASGEEMRYTLVNPREVNLAQGKISMASPIGKALLNRGKGDEVEVAAPVGMLHYHIEDIEG